MKFEWDSRKAASNLAKHGVSFDEAATALTDVLAVSGTDPDHSQAEDRYVTFGTSGLGRLLTVAHTYRGGGVRIISARRMTRSERRSMKKAEDELRASYKRSDFAKLERGKFHKAFSKGTTVALIDPEIAKAFPTSQAVNKALSTLLSIARETGAYSAPAKRGAKKRSAAA